MRFVVAAFAGHGVFDIKHFRMLTNPNVPIWLAAIWISFDISLTVFRTLFATRAPTITKTIGFRFLEAQSS